MTHRHRTIETDTRPFIGPVADRHNPRAHGGVCHVDRCACGAERRRNVNGRAEERGQWQAWIDPDGDSMAYLRRD